MRLIIVAIRYNYSNGWKNRLYWDIVSRCKNDGKVFDILILQCCILMLDCFKLAHINPYKCNNFFYICTFYANSKKPSLSESCISNKWIDVYKTSDSTSTSIVLIFKLVEFRAYTDPYSNWCIKYSQCINHYFLTVLFWIYVWKYIYPVNISLLNLN